MTGESDSPPTESNSSEGENEGGVSTGNTPTDIVSSNFNLDLLQGALEDFENVDWYHVSATTFHVGIFALLVWGVFFSLTLFLDYLRNSPSPWMTVMRSLSVLPFLIAAIAIFGIIARWSWQKMEDTPPPNSTILGKFKRVSIGSSSTLFILSVTSLFLATAARAGTHSVAVKMYGATFDPRQVVVVVLFDGLYIGFLLIGIGGLTSLIFTDAE